MKILAFNMYSWVSYLCTTRARQGKCPEYETIWAVAHFSIFVILPPIFCSDKISQFVALPHCMSNRAECDPIPKVTLGVQLSVEFTLQ